MRYVFAIVLCLWGPLYVYGYSADSSQYAQTDISILTCRSGDELYSTFGHTAIRVRNRASREDKVYNYGLFSFDTPNFYVKFMRGQLPYLLGRTDMHYFLREYQYEHRSVWEQQLLVSNEEKKSIIEFLEHNLLPENRAYAYDFFFDNCATRVVDVYDIYGRAGDSISYQNTIEKKTFRDLLKENLKSLPWSEFGIDIVIGAQADKLTNRRDQMFLPSYLMENLAHAVVHRDGQASDLASPAQLILDFEDDHERRQQKAIPWPLMLSSILLILTLVVNYKWPSIGIRYSKTVLVIAGVMGLFLLFMWFGTNHGATGYNYNVLWLNPWLLVLAVSAKLRRHVVAYGAMLGALVISGINCIFQILPQFFHLGFLPLILTIGICLWFMQKHDRSVAA